MNRTPSITTRTHATTSLGDTGEHVHAAIEFEFVVALSKGTASESLPLVIVTVLYILTGNLRLILFVTYLMMFVLV